MLTSIIAFTLIYVSGVYITLKLFSRLVSMINSGELELDAPSAFTPRVQMLVSGFSWVLPIIVFLFTAMVVIRGNLSGKYGKYIKLIYLTLLVMLLIVAPSMSIPH